MFKASVFALVLAVLCVSVCGQTAGGTTAQYCDASNPGPVIILNTANGQIAGAGVTLNPDPPVKGANETVSLFGVASQQISDGATLSLTITLFGFQVLPTLTYNVCEYPNTCPQGPGPVSAQVTIDGNTLPSFAPAATYGAHAVVSDASGNQLVCVDVTFNLVVNN